jgi:hypothetical protein
MVVSLVNMLRTDGLTYRISVTIKLIDPPELNSAVREVESDQRDINRQIQICLLIKDKQQLVNFYQLPRVPVMSMRGGCISAPHLNRKHQAS